MKQEKTLIILKPDCMESNSAGIAINRFLDAGLKIIACKMIQLTDDILKIHYAHHAEKPFFPEIVAFMKSCPVLILILQGNNAIKKVRDLLGPTDSTKAPKGTIRGDHGTNMMKNIAHASDSPESAEAEIARFFKREEIFPIA